MKKELTAPWIEVDLDAIARNTRNIRDHIGDQVKMMAVVKANAYGHDVVEVARTVLENGASSLVVARAEEGVFLRENGFSCPILVLGITMPPQADLLVEYDLTATVSDSQGAELLSEISLSRKTVTKVHIKIDTGMGRIGIKPEEALFFAETLLSQKGIEVEGIYTHFATADSADKDLTYQQYDLFNQVIEQLENHHIDIPVKHVANSAAILDLPETKFDAVRAGEILYGIYPSEEVSRSIFLEPVFQVKSRISFLKNYPSGKGLGYDQTFKTKRDSIIATLPGGYVDGYRWILSNRGRVLVNGKEVPVVGNLCMDSCVIDVTECPDVQVGDEVVLVGTQNGKFINVRDLVSMVQSTNDEIMTGFDNARVSKLFIREGRPWKIKNMFGEFLVE